MSGMVMLMAATLLLLASFAVVQSLLWMPALGLAVAGARRVAL